MQTGRLDEKTIAIVSMQLGSTCRDCFINAITAKPDDVNQSHSITFNNDTNNEPLLHCFPAMALLEESI